MMCDVDDDDGETNAANTTTTTTRYYRKEDIFRLNRLSRRRFRSRRLLKKATKKTRKEVHEKNVIRNDGLRLKLKNR